MRVQFQKLLIAFSAKQNFYNTMMAEVSTRVCVRVYVWMDVKTFARRIFQ